MDCRACGGGRLQVVFEMEPMPLAGSFAETRADALAAPLFPLRWLWCPTCGLVNVDPDVPESLIYDAYSYVTGDVPGLVRHHTEFAAWLAKRFGRARIRHLEIGGNDGTLIRRLPPAWDCTNVDPSDVARTHRTPGYYFVNEPFRGGLGTFDLITSSNAFAHFAGIGTALDAVRNSLNPGGYFVIEVHDLDETLASAQWDTIYHEHAVEWSTTALKRAGAIHGLRLVGIERQPLHGGLLRAVFDRGKSKDFQAPVKPDFLPLASAYAARKAPSLPPGSCAYGAAARATVYLYQTKADVEYVVDGSPRRAGRFVPGTGTPIVAPDRFDAKPPPAALITAWNHAADIKARHPDYRGKWVTAW